MEDLILTLGHNSSAILIRDNKLIAGYEEERLSGIKSDSHFPKLAISELDSRFKLKNPTIFVSHWQLHGNVEEMLPKHWDAGLVKYLFPKAQIFQTNTEFTHHDAHAWSAILFGEHMPNKAEDKTYIYVIDGFGTFGEHISIYRYVDGVPVLLTRKYGFGTSLGLLYQYTTAYLGMKQNQDEYKLLAFEAHIEQVIPKIHYGKLVEAIDIYSQIYITKLSSYMELDRADPMLNIGALPIFAGEVSNMLGTVLASVENLDKKLNERERKVVISYFTQSLVEKVVTYLIMQYNPNNILLAGGLFYNVKVNNLISSMVPGKTCIMPLAGDQGAGLGLYKAMHSGFDWPGHLYWGPRTLTEEGLSGIKNLEFYHSYASGIEAVDRLLGNNEIVNLVHGNMEFGPRALCHTSTLARPNRRNADVINFVNNRVNEMPFAPVMNDYWAKETLHDVNKIHKSLEYMICTRNVKSDALRLYDGACHKYPMQDQFTVRPQIIRSGPMTGLISDWGPLINTSFNYHGVPIVWSEPQIRHTHIMEQSHEVDFPPTTIVIGEQ